MKIRDIPKAIGEIELPTRETLARGIYAIVALAGIAIILWIFVYIVVLVVLAIITQATHVPLVDRARLADEAKVWSVAISAIILAFFRPWTTITDVSGKKKNN